MLLGIDGCEETLAKVKEIMHKYKNLKVMMMDKNVGTKSRNERCIKNETTQYTSVFDNRNNIFLNYKKYNNEKAIISLTSWTKRIGYVHETIDTILDKCKNIHMVLVLCENEFPKKEDELPLELKKRFDKFEILWVTHNTRSYKKVIPTMEKYKNIPIISADDDLFYVRDYVTELVNLYNADKTFATYSYRHDKMVTNCGAATLYNPKYYDLFIGMLNLAIPDYVIEDDMFLQYVIEKNNLKQCFAKTSFPYVTNKKNEIEPLHNEYKIGTSTQRKENYYSKIDSILNAKIVANLTTWTKRDWCLHPMLKNLKQQTLYPDRIVLWLSEEEYNKDKLPQSIQKCIDEKLLTDVMWVKNNTKGHKRYDCFKYFNDCYNILLDDDILYKPAFIEELVNETKKHQNCITVYSSYSVEYNGVHVTRGQFMKEPSHKNNFMAGLCCFPPYIFPFDAYENESMRNEYVLNCDESWYRPFFIKHDIKINVMYQWDGNSHYQIIDGSQDECLWRLNIKVMQNGMRDKERNFYNSIKITHTENICKQIWEKMDIDNYVIIKNN